MNLPSLALVTAPAEEPITVAEFKSWARVDIASDDTLIGILITGARTHVETITGLALVTQTWDAWFDGWPRGDELRLPKAPLQSVSYLKYTGIDEVLSAAVDTGEYVVDAYSRPGSIILRYNKSWPSADLSPSRGVTVRFVAGYGAAADVPMPLKMAIYLLAAHWFSNREAVLVSNAGARAVEGAELPLGVNALIANYRSWRI